MNIATFDVQLTEPRAGICAEPGVALYARGEAIHVEQVVGATLVARLMHHLTIVRIEDPDAGTLHGCLDSSGDRLFDRALRDGDSNTDELRLATAELVAQVDVCLERARRSLNETRDRDIRDQVIFHLDCSVREVDAQGRATRLIRGLDIGVSPGEAGVERRGIDHVGVGCGVGVDLRGLLAAVLKELSTEASPLHLNGGEALIRDDVLGNGRAAGGGEGGTECREDVDAHDGPPGSCPMPRGLSESWKGSPHAIARGRLS